MKGEDFNPDKDLNSLGCTAKQELRAWFESIMDSCYLRLVLLYLDSLQMEKQLAL